MNQEVSDWVGLDEAARLLAITPAALRELSFQGVIPSWPFNTPGLRYSRSALEAWVKDLEGKGVRIEKCVRDECGFRFGLGIVNLIRLGKTPDNFLVKELVGNVEKHLLTMVSQLWGYPNVPDPKLEAGDLLPWASGIYFVWGQTKGVAYVGQARILRRRVTLQHERIFKGDRLSWIEFPMAKLNWAECFYIGLCRPPRNFGGQKKTTASGS